MEKVDLLERPPSAAPGVPVQGAGEERFDVVLIGAGPVGLTLANFLGQAGVRTLLVEQREELIDYPRGVGLDDESLRTFQALGLVEQVRRHTVPDHAVHWTTADGEVLATMKPSERIYGWPRRNGFIQPLADRELLKGLQRLPAVQVRFGTTVAEVHEEDGCARIRLAAQGGPGPELKAAFVVGCDGGKSLVRKAMGVEFQGKTEPTQWIVVDIADDPVGTPSVYAVCDQKFPYVSAGLPGGVRRFEFMVPKDATEESLRASGEIERNIKKVLGDAPALNIIRSRVYTHNARVASSFRRGRLLIAGDAAHLMPVWQGQGYNTGIRDAANLGWKLAAVIHGRCHADLLDSYDRERRPHAAAMVEISNTAGRILVPRTRMHALVRNKLLALANKLPLLKEYMLQMRYKPMPHFTSGAVIAPLDSKNSPVGRLMIQPRVSDASGTPALLDDAIGQGFALVGWGPSHARYLTPEARQVLEKLGAGRFIVIPPCQQLPGPADPQASTLCDHDGKLQEWFDRWKCSVILLRPDRFVAFACRSMDVSGQLHAFVGAASLREARAESIH